MVIASRHLSTALALLVAMFAIAWGASQRPPQLPAPAGASANAVLQGQPMAQAASVGGHDVDRAPDGLFYVELMVNGQPVRFLVDTGASVVVLTAADAARVGISPDATRFNAHVQTAGGAAPMAWANLDQVQLAGREVRDLRAAVVRQGLQVSLLGQNMLSKLASVTIEGDRMRMR